MLGLLAAWLRAHMHSNKCHEVLLQSLWVHPGVHSGTGQDTGTNRATELVHGNAAMHLCQESRQYACTHAVHVQVTAPDPNMSLAWRERADRLSQGFCSPAPWPMPAKEGLRDTGLRLWDTVWPPQHVQHRSYGVVL